MYNFFIKDEARAGDLCRILGTDYNHLRNVLRLREDDRILVSVGGQSHLCRIDRFDADCAVCVILEEAYQNTELPIHVILYQGLPKSDKMEWIIQKAVELGAHEIVPVEMHRSIVKLDGKKKAAKQIRWQAIAESAAKQSKRNAIPTVSPVCPFAEAVRTAAGADIFLIPYEDARGMASTKDALCKIRAGMTVAILIGPEGGFEPREIEAAMSAGGLSVSLGSRILRTETAAVTAVGMCMLYAEANLDGGAV